MSVFGAMDVSASGMTAQQLRTDIISQNIANVNTTHNKNKKVYKRKTIVFEENERGIREIEINKVSEKELKICFCIKDTTVNVYAGFEKWITQEAVFDDEKHFLHSFSYAYADDKTLVIKQYWLNMSGYDVYIFHCQEDNINGIITTSVKLGGAVPIELAGKLQ